MRHQVRQAPDRRSPMASTATQSPSDLRHSADALVAEVPAEEFSLHALAENTGVELDEVRRCVPDTVALVAAMSEHWYQRLAVRLDPLLERCSPGGARLDAVVNAWLDLNLDTPGWPRLLQRFSDAPDIGEQLQHQLGRLAGIIAVDLAVDGEQTPIDSAARLVAKLPAMAVEEADVGRGCPDLRRELIASTIQTPSSGRRS